MSDFFHCLTLLAEVLLVYNQYQLEGYLVLCLLFPFLFHDFPVGEKMNKKSPKTKPNPIQPKSNHDELYTSSPYRSILPFACLLQNLLEKSILKPKVFFNG